MSQNLTLQEQIEDMRPDYGFTILSDGTVLRGRDSSSWDETSVQHWLKEWKKMKAKGCFDKGPGVAMPQPQGKLQSNASSSSDTYVHMYCAQTEEDKKNEIEDKDQKPIHKKRSNPKGKNKKGKK
eukprot:symbB.v1.2.039089.t1/scaffold6342.1/size18900/2